MSFKILLLPPDVDESWPEKIRQAVPGAVAKAFWDPQDALTEIEDADAAYGTVPPELFARAKKLRWICAARAWPGRRLVLRRARAERCRRDEHAGQLQRAPLQPTPWRSCSPLRVDSSTTCRRSSGREGRG